MTRSASATRKSRRAATSLPASLDWLESLARAGGGRPLAAHLEKIATTILREAGLPADAAVLATPEDAVDGLFPGGRTAGQRIADDPRVGALVRLQPRIIGKATDLRRHLARRNADDAAAAAASLALLAARAATLDPVRYAAPGGRNSATSKSGAARTTGVAARRRKVCLEIFRSERARVPSLTFTALCERVAVLARQREPALFRDTWSGRSVRRALERSDRR